VLIDADESGLHHDYGAWLKKLAPHASISQFRHNCTGKDNADVHMKRQIMGREVAVVQLRPTGPKLGLRTRSGEKPERNSGGYHMVPAAAVWGACLLWSVSPSLEEPRLTLFGASGLEPR
jgi:hypothetical protein